jgi:hypothetical protein
MSTSPTPRFSARQYQRRMMFAVLAYVVAIVLLYPLARDAAGLPAKLLFSLAPVPAVLYALWLAARRIWQSDELEQRLHLVGLGIASAVIAVVSVIGGFLAVADVLPADVMAILLLWIFPVLMICYGGTRWWVARRYGSDLACDGDDAIQLRWRLVILALMMGFIGLFAYLRRDAFDAGMVVGMASAAATLGLIRVFLYWRRRRDAARPEQP